MESHWDWSKIIYQRSLWNLLRSMFSLLILLDAFTAACCSRNTDTLLQMRWRKVENRQEQTEKDRNTSGNGTERRTWNPKSVGKKQTGSASSCWRKNQPRKSGCWWRTENSTKDATTGKYGGNEFLQNIYLFQKPRVALPRLPTLGGLLHQLQQMSSQNNGSAVSENYITARMVELCPKWKVTSDEAQAYLRQVRSFQFSISSERHLCSVVGHWREAKTVPPNGRGQLEARWPAPSSTIGKEALRARIRSCLQNCGSKDGAGRSPIRGGYVVSSDFWCWTNLPIFRPGNKSCWCRAEETGDSPVQATPVWNFEGFCRKEVSVILLFPLLILKTFPEWDWKTRRRRRRLRWKKNQRKWTLTFPLRRRRKNCELGTVVSTAANIIRVEGKWPGDWRRRRRRCWCTSRNRRTWPRTRWCSTPTLASGRSCLRTWSRPGLAQCILLSHYCYSCQQEARGDERGWKEKTGARQGGAARVPRLAHALLGFVQGDPNYKSADPDGDRRSWGFVSISIQPFRIYVRAWLINVKWILQHQVFKEAWKDIDDSSNRAREEDGGNTSEDNRSSKVAA